MASAEHSFLIESHAMVLFVYGPALCLTKLALLEGEKHDLILDVQERVKTLKVSNDTLPRASCRAIW